MAPVSQAVGNVATFHGIPNTTGLSLPSLFEMPKITATVPMTPSQTINSYPSFSMDLPQSSNQPTPNPSAFFPANLLMPCNLSFPTPQQLALYALQMHNQQNSPPAITNPLLNPTVFMPALIQQPFLGNLSLNGLHIQTSAALHHSFFNTPTTSNLSPITTTPNLNHPPTLISSQSLASNNAFQPVHPTPTSTQQEEQQAPPQLSQQQQVSPPIRNESPEFNDPNMPPMLQPELPCLNEFIDSDEFSAPPELMLPDRLMFDDECGPPRLEPQVPITILPETSEQSNDLYQAQLDSNTISPPSAENSPIKLNEHPLFANRPTLAAMLLSATQLPPTSPKLSVQSPTISTTSTTTDYVNTSRKRERSASVDSSDVMLKMPKLVSMVEECAPVAEKQKPQLEQEMSSMESCDELENTAPPALDSQTDEADEKMEDLTVEAEIASVEGNVQEKIEAEVVPTEKNVQKHIEERAQENSEEDTTADKHDTSLASSSGISSANSSLLAEEPIVIRFKRPVEAKEESVEPEKVSYNDFDEFYLPPSPLIPLQNKLRPRQQRSQPNKKQTRNIQAKSRPSTKTSIQSRKALSPMKNRRGAPKTKRVEIQSDWQPVDNGQLLDVRLHNETQSHKRRCFKAIQHSKEVDEIIRVRDCIKVRSSEGLENIGKVLRLFLDEHTGAISVQVLWYYTPEQTPSDITLHEKELLASKHCDVINADTIEEHAFVLTFAEYCRFVAETRLDELPPSQRPLESNEIASRGELNYTRRVRLPHEDSPIDLVYWCNRTFSIKTKKVCVSAMNSRRGSRNGRKR